MCALTDNPTHTALLHTHIYPSLYEYIYTHIYPTLYEYIYTRTFTRLFMNICVYPSTIVATCVSFFSWVCAWEFIYGWFFFSATSRFRVFSWNVWSIFRPGRPATRVPSCLLHSFCHFCPFSRPLNQPRAFVFASFFAVWFDI